MNAQIIMAQNGCTDHNYAEWMPRSLSRRMDARSLLRRMDARIVNEQHDRKDNFCTEWMPISLLLNIEVEITIVLNVCCDHYCAELTLLLGNFAVMIIIACRKDIVM